MRTLFRPGAGLAAAAVILPLVLPAEARAAPDLTARIVSVSPQSATAGSQVSVRTELRNRGSSSANLNRKRADRTAVHAVRWFIRENGTGPDKLIMVMSMPGTLRSGQARTVTPGPAIPKGTPPGQHAMCVVIDPENRVRESNERNNLSCVSIRVDDDGTTPVPATPIPETPPEIAEPAPGCPDTLPAPRPVSPRNGSTFGHFPRATHFSWSPVPNAGSYSVEVDCLHCCVQGKWCTDMGKVWHLRKGLTDTDYVHNFVGAQPGRWRIWAVDTCGRMGKVSGWWKFEYIR